MSNATFGLGRGLAAPPIFPQRQSRNSTNPCLWRGEVRSGSGTAATADLSLRRRTTNKEKQNEKPKEIKVEWGKGLAQKRKAEAMFQETEVEKNKPFARSRDDIELDTMLKERVRWGDPMAHLVKKKKYEPVVADLGDNEKMKESGFLIPQDIPSHSWIKRGLEPALNRYGIRPGRHWDGVDHSTGYEKEMFQRMNEKKASEQEAYQWSVADM